ncbi:hypothetical protein [Ornithinimicrobium murale]|uniref:hypothetical protein n=1 Tax=Ornithinimicrobium murale TaxID=1050153 RepID=UPI0013B43586|nr:hypothetical protein [Ornithinimicrobium murale]
MNTTSAQPTRDVLAAYRGAGHDPSTRHFTAHMRAASASHLVNRGRPLRRMAGPGGLHRSGTEPDGRNTVPVWIGKEGTMLSMPGEGLPPVRATASQVRTILDSAQYLLMPLTPRAASALESAIERDGDPELRKVAQHVGVLRRMTASSKMLVLSAALSRTFWTPVEQENDDVTAWAAALGTSDDPDGWRELAGHAMTPAHDYQAKHTDESGMASVREYGKIIRDTEDRIASDVLRRRSATSAATGFEMATSVEEHFGAICRTDELLIPFYLLSGEVVEVSGRRWEGGSVVGALSTPSKVRTGDVLAILGRRVVDLRLADLGYDEQSETLLGVFGRTIRTQEKGRGPSAAALAVLSDVVEHSGPVYITISPFGSFGTASTVKWSRADETSMDPLAPISMPLDVAVAGAPVGD